MNGEATPQQDLFNRLLFSCNKALGQGVTPPELIGLLEMVKQGVLQTTVKANPASPIILPKAARIGGPMSNETLGLLARHNLSALLSLRKHSSYMLRFWLRHEPITVEEEEFHPAWIAQRWADLMGIEEAI